MQVSSRPEIPEDSDYYKIRNALLQQHGVGPQKFQYGYIEGYGVSYFYETRIDDDPRYRCAVLFEFDLEGNFVNVAVDWR